MDRELLFRGKREDNGDWVYGFVTRMLGQIHIVDIDNENTAYMVIPETVGQYTYKKDKNNSLIFEGDILEFTDEYEGDKELFKVYWGEDESAFMISALDCEGVHPMSNWEVDRWEVISNLYEQ